MVVVAGGRYVCERLFTFCIVVKCDLVSIRSHFGHSVAGYALQALIDTAWTSGLVAVISSTCR